MTEHAQPGILEAPEISGERNFDHNISDIKCSKQKRTRLNTFTTPLGLYQRTFQDCSNERGKQTVILTT